MNILTKDNLTSIRNISTKELRFICVDDGEEDHVEKLRIKVIFKLLFKTSIPVLILALGLTLIILDIANITNLIAGLISIVVSVGLAIVSMPNIKRLKVVIGNGYRTAQYGNVERKYVEKNRGFFKTKVKYADVLFVYNDTRLRKVECSKQQYEEIEEGDDILIVSFDPKKAYVITL